MSFKEDVVQELHKPARRNFRRRRVIVKGLNDLYQADLVEMIPYSKFNKGFRYILVVINVFSKYVWAYPVKRKSGKDVSDAMQKILKHGLPKNLQTDLGKEFYNKDFQNLMQKHHINHYSTYSNLKASVVERCNRTLKNLMWKQFSLQGNYKWLDLLPKIVDKYNSSIHRTIRMKPKDVKTKHEKLLLQSAYSNLKTVDFKPQKFQAGDYVRISKFREAFSKGYTPNWSNEIFQIHKVQETNPRTYQLIDSSNQQIQGGFYDHELQKVKHKDVYLIEKVLRRKGKNMFVKWLGLDKTNNSWIPISNVQ